MPGIHAALGDLDIPDVVLMKASQIGWTIGAIINFIFWAIDTLARGIIVMFPRKESGQSFVQEKFNPSVDVTPRIRDKVPTSTARKDGNKELFRKFPGGWIKFIGSHSATGAKSSSAPFVLFEEPDDADIDVQGQGGAIRLLKERTKTFRRPKRIVGGTPTIKGLSAIEHAYRVSDQRKFFVPCDECAEVHVLSWDHVHWPEDADIEHEVYGRAIPDSAWYACPHCDARWSDLQKNRNVARAESAGFGWQATATFTGVAGFHISELYSPFPGSRFSIMVRKYLEARHKESQGDITDLIAFWNNQLGEPYEYRGDTPDADVLAERVETYEEMMVFHGGLRLTAGVDVQHNRIALVIRAWGRGEESWLVYWGELYVGKDGGSTADTTDPVWDELDKMLFGPIRHASGTQMHIAAASIDASDGQTSDAVYKFVRDRRRRGVLRAVKGASEQANRNTDREIYSAPRKVDFKSDTKATKYGLKVYQVGTTKAKDLISERLKLTGAGPGRMHVYQGVRGDYFEQVTAEVKAPDRRRGGRKSWQLKSGRRNEGLDCEVYALHAARAIKVHTMSPGQWDALERRVTQGDLFTKPGTGEETPAKKSPWSQWNAGSTA